MKMRSQLGRLGAAVGLTAACAGCAGPDPHSGQASTMTPPGPHAAPTRAADCADLPALHGDPGIVLGTDWSGEHHDYGDPVTVYGCVSPSLGGEVSLVAPATGVRVSPTAVPVDPSGSGIVRFRVTVEHASGGLRIRLTGGGVEADLPGPTVARDVDGWHVVPRAS